MKEWQITDKEQMSVIERTGGQPGEHEIKVKVTKVAITSIDIALFLDKTEKPYPIVPGRIAAGLISEASETTGYKKGERVLLSPYIIGKNQPNNSGMPVRVMGVDEDGFLADFVVLPESNVYSLPDGVSDEDALFVEYVAMASKALQAMNVDKQEYLAIFGSTALGNIIGQLAIYYKAIPILIDKDDEKLRIAENCGIYYTINSEKENVKNKVKEITGGKYANNTLFSCRATQDPPLAFEITAYGGKVGIIGYNRYVNKLAADLRPILLKRLSVIGINSGIQHIDIALNLLANEAVNVKPLINKTVEFEEAEQYIRESAENQEKYLKVIVNC